MNALKFEINIDNNWHELSPIFNNFSISRKRDAEQIFVVQTFASGDLNFNCSDYELLIPFVGQTLSGKLTETICGNSKIYDIDFILSNKYDFYLKTIKSKVVIKDKYYKLYNNKNKITFDTPKNILTLLENDNLIDIENDIVQINKINLLSLVNTLLSFSTNEVALDTYEYSPYYGGKFLTDLGLNELIFSTIKNIVKYGATSDRETFEISTSELINYIKNQFFSGFYLTSFINNPGVYFMIFNWFGNISLWYNNLDLTNEENTNDKNILFLNNNKNAILKFKTFLFNKDKMNEISKFYDDLIVEFETKNDKTKNINILNSDIRQAEINKEMPCIFEVDKSTQSFNFGEYNSQYYNDEVHPFNYADGDFNSLTLNSISGNLSKIHFGDLSQFRMNANLELAFDCNISHQTDLFIYDNQTKFYIQPGHNIITLQDYDNWRYNLSIQSDATGFTNLKFTNMIVTVRPTQLYYSLHPFVIGSSTYPSGRTSANYLVENFGAEMPENIATIDDIDYSVLESNKFQQQISFNYKDNIGNLDEFGLIKTSLGWLRIDEMERKYSNNYYSDLKLTLTGKKYVKISNK